MNNRRTFVVLLLFICTWPATAADRVEAERILRAPAEAPYPPSRVVGGVRIDWSSHQRGAIGSDNFMMTWADDDHQYGIWGDGGGFGGDNKKYRVLLGVARIEGAHNDFRAFNRFGHRDNSEHEANVTGKSWGMVSVDGILYAWVHPDPPSGTGGQWPWIFREARLHSSADHGAQWKPASWAFTSQDGLVGRNILQFGRDYAGARDEFRIMSLLSSSPQNVGLDAPRKTAVARVQNQPCGADGPAPFGVKEADAVDGGAGNSDEPSAQPENSQHPTSNIQHRVPCESWMLADLFTARRV